MVSLKLPLSFSFDFACSLSVSNVDMSDGETRFFFYITLLSITLSKILFKKSTTVVRIRSFVRSICLLALRNSSGFFFWNFFVVLLFESFRILASFLRTVVTTVEFLAWHTPICSLSHIYYILFSLVCALRYAY